MAADLPTADLVLGATLALLQELSYLYHNCKDIEFEVFSPFEGQLLNDFRRLCRTQFLQYRYRDKIKRYLWTRILRKPYLYGYKKGEFDLIYANTVTMASIAFMLKQELEIPCILHFHEAETSNFLTPIRKEHVVGHDLFITVSELTKKNVIHNYGIHPSKILIQPPLSYWLDQCPQDKEQIDPLPDSGSKILIGLCGRYDWVKSSDLIPVIIKLFFTRHPDKRNALQIAVPQRQTARNVGGGTAPPARHRRNAGKTANPCGRWICARRL